MSWSILPAMSTIVAAVILLIRGLWILLNDQPSDHIRWFGVLAVLLASLSLLWDALFFTRTLVLSSELTMLMVQGSTAWYELSVLIVGISVSGSIGMYVAYLKAEEWHTARLTISGNDFSNKTDLIFRQLYLENMQPEDKRVIQKRLRLRWLIAIGITVGLVSVRSLTPLNSNAPVPLRVYGYDLLWPPLVIWVIACVISGIFAILHYYYPRIHNTVICILVLIVGSYRPIVNYTVPRMWSSATHFIRFNHYALSYWSVCILIIIVLLFWYTTSTVYKWSRGTLVWPRLPWPGAKQLLLSAILIVTDLSLVILFFNISIVANVAPNAAMLAFVVGWILFSLILPQSYLSTFFQRFQQGAALITLPPIRTKSTANNAPPAANDANSTLR